MKLTIGENIRKFRKKNDLTQEALAERLGVTYQSVSRWENGTTYPDLEFLPAISELLGVSADELIGMPQIEKEKKAAEAFDELRRECMKRDYDAEHIIALLRDIRRNYIASESAWRPWVAGNDRAFRDPKILPEVRLLAEAYLEREPMAPGTIQTMAYVEDEENLESFLKKYTTPFDCSARALLFNRYMRRKDEERFEAERRYKLYEAFNVLLSQRCFYNWKAGGESKDAADEFMENMLAFIRGDAEDERPDMWVETRLEFGLKSAARAAGDDKFEEAVSKVEAVVKLLEEVMKITDKVLLPTSCRFLEGMEWEAYESWHATDNGPDTPKERMIYISTPMSGMCACYCSYPSEYFAKLRGKAFEALRGNPDFE
ncbi:MAG: helix-turn-helix transcriptional regulator, partial [Clostridia bacterium]|nr:helix-turn-helix transcriptional regulator [Clostridia bacterium]